MPGRDAGLKALLKEIDESLDEVLKKMDRWEEDLHRVMRKGDREQVIEVAQKGGAFSRSSRDARDELLQVKGTYKEDLSDGALDEANAAVEAKLDRIDERLQAAMDELMAQQEAMDDKTRRAMEAMEGLGDVDLYPDGNGKDDLSEMKKDYDKKQKAKK